MRRSPHTLVALAAVLFAGCIGAEAAPEACGDESACEAETPSADPQAPVSSAEWRRAPAGCEGVARAARRADDPQPRLRRVEGEPALGALTDDEGNVLCVDARALLAAELQMANAVDVRASDPSPQPSHPGVAGR